MAARFVRDEEAAGSNPATPTQVTGHSLSWDVAFSLPYSSKVQQRLRAKLPPEPLERFQCLGVRDLGVDIPRHADLRMAEDVHGNPGIKAATAAPLARRQRPGLWPWEAPPGHMPGRKSQNAQIKRLMTTATSSM